MGSFRRGVDGGDVAGGRRQAAGGGGGSVAAKDGFGVVVDGKLDGDGWREEGWLWQSGYGQIWG
jgi:hypothetical protein